MLPASMTSTVPSVCSSVMPAPLACVTTLRAGKMADLLGVLSWFYWHGAQAVL